MSVPISDLIRIFGRIGLLSFGGPAAQIALMHKELVAERAWLSEAQFLNALSFCMLLPGPEAMQLATYAGWRLDGMRGGLIAGLLFVLPGAVVILALASLYAVFGQVPLVAAMFLGIKAAVVIIVLQALLKVAARALRSGLAYAVAGAAFVALFAFDLPFPLVIAVAASIGALSMAGKAGDTVAPVRTEGALKVLAIWLMIWLLPLALLWLGAPGLLAEIGVFFAKLAVVTFGGAYAVLAYMVQAVVGEFGWLNTGQMMDALGLAETTPGPLILVTEFVGFMAGYAQGGWWLGLAGAVITLWVTFAPCFLWIFLGAPYVEWIGAQPRLAGALAGITAAVVGVILNLSLWFALTVFFTDGARVAFGPAALWVPDWSSFVPGAVLLSLVAAGLLLWRKMDLLAVLPIMAASGIALSWIYG